MESLDRAVKRLIELEQSVQMQETILSGFRREITSVLVDVKDISRTIENERASVYSRDSQSSKNESHVNLGGQRRMSRVSFSDSQSQLPNQQNTSSQNVLKKNSYKDSQPVLPTITQDSNSSFGSSRFISRDGQNEVLMTHKAGNPHLPPRTRRKSFIIPGDDSKKLNAYKPSPLVHNETSDNDLPVIPINDPTFFSVNTESIIAVSVPRTDSEQKDADEKPPQTTTENNNQNPTILLSVQGQQQDPATISSKLILQKVCDEPLSASDSSIDSSSNNTKKSKLKSRPSMTQSENSIDQISKPRTNTTNTIRTAKGGSSMLVIDARKLAQENAWKEAESRSQLHSLTRSTDIIATRPNSPIMRRKSSVVAEARAAAAASKKSVNSASFVSKSRVIESLPWYRKVFAHPSISDRFQLDGLKIVFDPTPSADSAFSMTLHPSSLVSELWDIFIFLCRAIQFLLIPLSIGFHDAYSWLLPISIWFFIISLIDIFLTTRTGYLHDKDVLEMSAVRIWAAYKKSGKFALDLFVCFPYGLIIDAVVSPETNSVWRLISIINTTALIIHFFNRSRRTSTFYQEFLEFVRRSEIPAAAVTLVQIILSMIAWWHWVSCATSFFKTVGVIPDSFGGESWLDRYTIGFYNGAAEMLAAGFGAEVPVGTTDRWIRIANMVLGALFSAAFIGNISSFIIGLDSSGRLFNEKIEEVNQYINYKGFSSVLKRRILEYYNLKYDKGKFFDEKKIMAELNQPLRQHISLQDCEEIVLKVPFFKEADSFFISQIVLILKLEHYLPGDFVIQEGDYGDEMYFISKGVLEVSIGDVPRTKMQQGWFFGEIALLFGRMRRTASIRYYFMFVRMF